MKLNIFKKALLVLGLSVITDGIVITAPLASNTTPVMAAAVTNTLTAYSFLGTQPITPCTYETKLSSGKYVIKGETVKNANLPLLTTVAPKKIVQTKNGNITVADGDIRFVKINDKSAWRYVYGGIVQTKFSGWVHNSVTGAKPDFIKFTNGLVDVTATNKGCSEPLQISISNLSNIGLIGTKYKLTPTLSPDISGKITWGSSNTSIATVNSSGIVSFLKKGAVNITAKLDSGAYSTLYMKVYDVEDEDMRFNNAGQIGSILPNLYIGATKQLTAETVKNGFPVKFVNTGSSSIPFVQATWKSSDTKILTVNQSGLVKGVSAGKATVTATTKKER